MNSELRKKVIDALRLQQEIFGDELYVNISTDKEIFNSNNIIQKISEKVEINFAENLFQESFLSASSLEELDSMINQCQKCPLGKTRTKFVFGVGNPNAHAMLIGEAPGADEDLQGEPFVGRAGKLLNDILKAINLRREDVYIANILKCRPPGNRDPLPSEIETCIPYLHKQIDLIKPKIILCLGRIAANGLLNKKLSLTTLRENIYEFNGIKVLVTYHPAALLRNPQWKRGCWEDVKKFKKLYDELLEK
ncbi:MAG: uracil-DNA glycosylase [Melioribacter sp.]|nr:uracil-DNA glycosylase [Melioribacter sp.]